MPEPPTDAIAQCEFEPTELDIDILAVLDERGRQTPRMTRQQLETDVSRSWVCRRLQRLTEDGPVTRIDRGLYQLDYE